MCCIIMTEVWNCQKILREKGPAGAGNEKSGKQGTWAGTEDDQLDQSHGRGNGGPVPVG